MREFLKDIIVIKVVVYDKSLYKWNGTRNAENSSRNSDSTVILKVNQEILVITKWEMKELFQ